MKDNKIIGLMNKVRGLTNIVKHLVQEVQKNTTLAKGTLTAFQLHLGEKKWNKLVEELKKVEKKDFKSDEKKLDLDVE
jgi:TRAP-type C4-dicarboxylate transport system substrate-binding protein